MPLPIAVPEVRENAILNVPNNPAERMTLITTGEPSFTSKLLELMLMIPLALSLAVIVVVNCRVVPREGTESISDTSPA